MFLFTSKLAPQHISIQSHSRCKFGYIIDSESLLYVISWSHIFCPEKSGWDYDFSRIIEGKTEIRPKSSFFKILWIPFWIRPSTECFFGPFVLNILFNNIPIFFIPLWPNMLDFCPSIRMIETFGNENVWSHCPMVFSKLSKEKIAMLSGSKFWKSFE